LGTVFGVNEILFANDVVGNLPTSGVNTIVLQTFDNDADPITPFGAGNAANLIAGQITTPGPGFFIYFNSGLNLPRLVYSTDLDDNQADLKVLFRMTNLLGQPGALATFNESNFEIIPLPSTLLLFGSGLLGLWRARKKFKK
jgi:PEP-CTERM motif